jgi:Flp pilus assembly protein TadD
MEQELRRYLEQGKFNALDLYVPSDLSAPRLMATRRLTPVEVWFRLGDELLRVGRLESAESYFDQARKLAPASPLPYEGLGLLAAQRQQPEEAARFLHEALQRGSTSFLTHYVYAREKFELTAPAQDNYAPVGKALAAEIRSELLKALRLMPDFGPAHHLLGFFELVQAEDLRSAEAHLQRAIELEPEKPSYLLSLAQAQMAKKDLRAARGTLEALRLPYVEAPLRAHAEELLKELGQAPKGSGRGGR